MQDIPKFYTALAEWLACLAFVILLPKRFGTGVTALGMAAALAALCGIQHVIGIVPISIWLLCMGIALAMMYGLLLLFCRITATDAGFYWAIAFIFAEFIASLDWQLYSFAADSGYDSYPLQAIFLFVFYGIPFFIFLRMQHRRLSDGQALQVTRREVMSAAIMAVGAFLISNISYVSSDTPFSGRMSMEIFYIRTLVDLAGLIMLIGLQDRWQELQVRKEVDAINGLLQRQYEQYRQSRENIEVINRKYHDLKHQIHIIRMEKDEGKREEYLRQMESGMQSFGITHETGSPVLDTILAGKQMYCIQHGIHLTVVADGGKLDFIEVMDLCSVFGNALDNAIESVEKLKQEEKRLIRLAVYTQNNFLMIRVENYFETPLQLGEEGYETTKGDRNYHGYGLKSIRFMAEKYGGSVSIQTEENWFSLRVLIPLPEDKRE
ncbi:MAG: GHKL domain-containing protein [Oscillospiraceae bacterium]|nr:GHKL domain-containing protein [Oscillospiraceae bacterium]